ncbi:MAG: uroporphyrinogen decarboxylase [Anaerolineae bacterium]|nr:uroporphyrinogen decarboxylase [Anaerolineae bacterium]
MLSKRERLEKTFAGEITDRVPVALWRHWPGDDQRAADLAASTLEFQRRYDWDFVKISPASSFCLTDYGVQDRWVGNIEGTREYTRRVVDRSLDWTELRVLDPRRGALGRQLEAVRLIGDGLPADVPAIQTIFSPLAQARNLAGKERLLEQMRTAPERVHTGLNTITDSTLRFIEELQRTSVAGLYYAVQMASYDALTEEEYRVFGRPYDLRILEALSSRWWFNMLHVHGDSTPMFDLFCDYPVQAINWHDRDAGPDLATGKTRFSGAVCGGLSHWVPVHHGTPAEIRDQARDALEQTGRRRVILSTGCVMMITTPWSNIRMVRDVVDQDL